MLKCDDCGKTNRTVEKTTCPYASEIQEEEVEVYLCNDCYLERAGDI
tara:strand:- start:11 stop:151 length:141 start_codon:yes stop_codon:yes gene_type:complete